MTSPDTPVDGSSREPLALLRYAVTHFGELVSQVREEQWGNRTPCADWTVRDLVNHVAVEDLWAAELFPGATIEQVGSRFDGDQLGPAPLAVWQHASSAALASAGAADAMTKLVHLSFGDFPGSEYAMQLFADHLVHSWDLAVGIGAQPALSEHAVAACLDWFAPMEAAYRSSGAVGPRPTVGPDADATTTLLAAFGRSA
ncbi:MAG: TIGR03086 family metal-binding protein [Dermatophilaceae bacterium]